MNTFKRGDQIAYIPNHAGNRITHPDVEFGFVTSITEHAIFCRYWRKDLKELRTKSCSEATPHNYLVYYTSVTNLQLRKVLKEIECIKMTTPKTRQ